MNRGTYSRAKTGTSLVELVLSAAIIGLVIAGVSQAIFTNTAWFSVLQNRLDNGMAARLFLRKLGSDIRMSYLVDASSTSSSLILYALQPSKFNSDGFFNDPTPLNSSKITYSTEPDPQNPQMFRIHYTNSGTKEDRYILVGVLGPLSATDGNSACTFQYVSRQYPYAETDTPSPLPTQPVGTVVLNLELRRAFYGSDTGAFHRVASGIRQKSAIAIRSEFLLRNSLLHGNN